MKQHNIPSTDDVFNAGIRLGQVQYVIELYNAKIITANRAAEKLGCERAHFLQLIDLLEKGKNNA